MHAIRRWFSIKRDTTTRVDALYDRANAETEAVSQEAKALKNDVRRVCGNADAFDAFISDMRRAHQARMTPTRH